MWPAKAHGFSPPADLRVEQGRTFRVHWDPRLRQPRRLLEQADGARWGQTSLAVLSTRNVRLIPKFTCFLHCADSLIPQHSDWLLQQRSRVIASVTDFSKHIWWPLPPYIVSVDILTVWIGVLPLTGSFLSTLIFLVFWRRVLHHLDSVDLDLVLDLHGFLLKLLS